MNMNWAGNVVYAAERVVSPKTVEEIQEAVRAHRQVKAVGTRHCFGRIADTEGVQISTQGLNRIEAITPESVILGAGMRYGELAPSLQDNGLALHNLASLPHISIGGAIATATHGSGDSLGNLSTAVRAMELVAADGEIHRFTPESADFAGAVVHLGALGIVTRLELAVEPHYDLAQVVFERLPFDSALENLDAITGAGRSVSLFTTWTTPEIDHVWVKGPREPISNFFGAKPATEPHHPLRGMPTEFCTPQLGVSGPWFERLPHFRLEFTPSNGAELQSEFLLPRSKAREAMIAVSNLRERISPLLQVCEIRTMRGDDLWLSGAYGRDTVAIHFTWVADQPAVEALLPTLEAQIFALGGRPHWGKLFLAGASEIAPLYPRFDDFLALRDRLDPNRKFGNSFLRHTLGG